MLIMATILEQNKQYYYNYISIVNNITKLLNDSKAKIKHVALETLVVIANTEGINQVLDRIESDDLTIEKLKARFRKKAVPVLRDDGVELPKITPSSAPVVRDIQKAGSYNENIDSPNIFAKALTEKLEPLARTNFIPQKRAISVSRNFSANKSLDNKHDDNSMSSPKRSPIKPLEVSYLKKDELTPIENPELELQHYLRISPND